MNTVLCAEVAVEHGTVDFNGNIGKVQFISHQVVQLTLASVVGTEESSDRGKGSMGVRNEVRLVSMPHLGERKGPALRCYRR